MTALLYLLGVVLFVGAILVSIGLHELGHMIPAKRFGGKVTQYFIGFGPTVWSRQVGETEYGLKAIPLGGYVKIVGMLPPGAAELGEVTYDAEGQQVTRVRKSNTGLFTQLISDARAAEWELVQPGDEDRLFYKLPPWKKIVVMAGGPSVNILIAFALFWGIYATYGNVVDIEAEAGPPVIDTVSECVIPFTEEGRACTDSDPLAPAYEAGLRPGDVVTSFNGTAVTGWDQLRELIRGNADGDAVIGYERDGQLLTGETSTTVQARPTGDSTETLTEVGFLGVTPTVRYVTETGGPIYTARQMAGMTKDTVVALGQLPVKVWGVAKAIVGVEERAIDSPVSIVGGGRIAGTVSSTDQLDVAEKAVSLAGLVAGFNLFIGLFNFLPLLPLDGGHIASATWEWVRRGWARLFRRPDPGYVDAAKLLPVAYVVASALLVMGVVLIVGDLVVPVQFDA
ncbi:site-2 protease family protein [uncultured Nocardioides sp.]|uniref:M50 family metallopeptidase n=1 Tax=uncultured Nocardioides sp. TaxID=198441 RepID=UPI000C63FEF1|nr:zinc metalloprotease [Nocardioides sp.]